MCQSRSLCTVTETRQKKLRKKPAPLPARAHERCDCSDVGRRTLICSPAEAIGQLKSLAGPSGRPIDQQVPCMQSVAIRDAAASDSQSICALNLAEVQHTSPMDLARLATLGNLACYFKVACVDGCVSAFLLAMCSGSPYENDNFSWFARKYTRF